MFRKLKNIVERHKSFCKSIVEMAMTFWTRKIFLVDIFALLFFCYRHLNCFFFQSRNTNNNYLYFIQVTKQALLGSRWLLCRGTIFLIVYGLWLSFELSMEKIFQCPRKKLRFSNTNNIRFFLVKYRLLSTIFISTLICGKSCINYLKVYFLGVAEANFLITAFHFDEKKNTSPVPIIIGNSSSQ